MSRRTQPPWMANVRVGSVLLTRSGKPRAVRAVTRYKNGDLACVTFAIRRCSWTTRPSTTMNYTDLRCCGYTLVPGVRVKLDREVDAKFNQSMHAKRANLCVLRCTDVGGML